MQLINVHPDRSKAPKESQLHYGTVQNPSKKTLAGSIIELAATNDLWFFLMLFLLIRISGCCFSFSFKASGASLFDLLGGSPEKERRMSSLGLDSGRKVAPKEWVIRKNKIFLGYVVALLASIHYIIYNIYIYIYFFFSCECDAWRRHPICSSSIPLAAKRRSPEEIPGISRGKSRIFIDKLLREVISRDRQ